MTPTRDDVIRRLHQGVDPFAGFDPARWTDPTDEWDSHHPWMSQLVTQLHPRVIVEVGSFLGASSRHFARALQALDDGGVVVCVDTWLAERVLWDSPEWRPHLRIEHGRPQYYKAWLANAMAARLQSYLCPLSMDSSSGARYLAAHGVAAELVYIDGSHAEGDVHRDLTLYWDLVLGLGGWLLVDDYAPGNPDFVGVVADVDRFAQERGLMFETNGIKARARKEK